MSVINQQTVNGYREENTRKIAMPDGSLWEVRMTPELWDDLDFLKAIEGVSEGMIGVYALEEMSLQEVTFDRAFRGVVAHLASRWQ